MTTNTKISNLVFSQMPFFVKNDHLMFIEFMKAYYEWAEQQGETVDVIKNIGSSFDADRAVDIFMDELEKNFIPNIPREALVDRALLIKHVKDFYRSRGTEKSISFLLRILFGGVADGVDFYYPKTDILRASDGKWFIEKSLKLADVYIDGVLSTDDGLIQNVLKNTQIRGNTSAATAVVERVDVYYDGPALVRELKLSQQTKDFVSGEVLFTLYNDDAGQTHTIAANTYSGIINKVNLIASGIGYSAGIDIPLKSNSGTGGVVQIASVTTGNILSVYVVDGGAGFQSNNYLLFSSSGANAYIANVASDGYYHPNTYNIVSSIIGLEANTAIGNAQYSNLNASLSDPANNAIANSMSYFVYANTGPARFVTIVSGGSNVSVIPDVSVVANTRIRELGILGKMKIVSGGTNYQKGDTIVFNNVPFGYGVGAAANVANVDDNGSITEVHFVPVLGFQIGGSGYDQNYLPKANVISSNGTGANIAVIAVLGYGTTFRPLSDSIGAIKSLVIVSGGSGYTTAPTLDLTKLGDGTAQANVTIVTGSYTYPGRYLNDDGHLSAYNFLQDQDYYQDFSYVVKIGKSINNYRTYLKNLIHPAGMKLFGEYLIGDEQPAINSGFQTANTTMSILAHDSYVLKTNANATTLTVTTNQTVNSNISNVYISFLSGNALGVLKNGYYNVSYNSASSYVYYTANLNTSGTGWLISVL